MLRSSVVAKFDELAWSIE